MNEHFVILVGDKIRGKVEFWKSKDNKYFRRVIDTGNTVQVSKGLYDYAKKVHEAQKKKG